MTDPGPGPVLASPSPAETNIMAIVSVIAGGVAVVIGLFVSAVIGAILGFLAIGLGGVARGQAGAKGGMPIAIAGMVLGWIAVGLNIYVAIAD